MTNFLDTLRDTVNRLKASLVLAESALEQLGGGSVPGPSVKVNGSPIHSSIIGTVTPSEAGYALQTLRGKRLKQKMDKARKARWASLEAHQKHSERMKRQPRQGKSWVSGEAGTIPLYGRSKSVIADGRSAAWTPERRAKQSRAMRASHRRRKLAGHNL